jgi:nitroreductase
LEENNLYRFRLADWNVYPIFRERWSPRAMSGEEITHEELMTLFEAARWAPSSNNYQPWRFLYARRNTPIWDTFYGLLTEGNKLWCRNAAVLIVVISRTVFNTGKPARSHSFDTGAAWMSLALQGHLMGLMVHAMQGFDYDRAGTELAVPGDYSVEAMIAVGRPGKAEDLPEEKRKMEFPKGRKNVFEFITEGPFK